MSNGMAVGLIETKGLTSAAAALDAAIKAAQVKCIGVEKVIGVNKVISVTICIEGEVAAVQSAVSAGEEAGNRVGQVFAARVIPRPHGDVQKLVGLFRPTDKAKVKEAPKASPRPAAEASGEENEAKRK